MTDQGTTSTNDTKYQVIVNDVVILWCDTFKEACEVYDRQCDRIMGLEGRPPGGSVVLRENDAAIYKCASYPAKADDQSVKKSAEPIDTERRVGIALAVGRYLRSADRFNDASKEFTAACKSLRKQLGVNKQLTVQVDARQYLVRTDRDGNFDVEPIESI